MIRGPLGVAAARISVLLLFINAVTPAQAQIAEDVPAAAFLPQIRADIAKAQRLLEEGVWTASEQQDANITVHWSGLSHSSRAPDSGCTLGEIMQGTCPFLDFLNCTEGDCPFPEIPEGDLVDTSLVWDIFDEAGNVVQQFWIGFFADAVPVFENEELVAYENEGELTGSEFGTYMMLGMIRPNATAHWAMFVLPSFTDEDLELSPLEWEWEFAKSGVSVVSEDSHLVVADATAIEYGLIAALVSVAAVAALTSLGEALDTMFSVVGFLPGYNPAPGSCDDDTEPDCDS